MATCSRVNGRSSTVAVARALSDDPALGPAAGWAVAEAVAEHWFAAGELERALPASVAAGDAARGCWPSPARSVTTSGRWSCGIRWPTRRRWPASDVPSCSIERPRWPAGPATTSAPSAMATPPSTSWSTPPPRRRSWLCCMRRSVNYLWWAGRDAEMRRVDGVRPGAGPVRTPDPGTRRHPGLSRPRLVHRLSGTRKQSQVAEAAHRGGTPHRRPQAGGPGPRALGVCLTMTSTDPEAGIREFEHVVAIGREIGDADEVASAYACLSDTLIRLGRLDEAAAAGPGGVRRWRGAGSFPRAAFGLGLWNGAEALFLAGRWDECATGARAAPRPALWRNHGAVGARAHRPARGLAWERRCRDGPP